MAQRDPDLLNLVQLLQLELEDREAELEELRQVIRPLVRVAIRQHTARQQRRVWVVPVAPGGWE